MSDSNQTNPQNQTSQKCKTRKCLKNGKICCLIIFNILLIIADALVLALVLPYQGNLKFDYYGAIIGILSLLVMVLVTWNIYNAIDFSGQLNKVIRENKNLILEMKKIKEEVVDITEQAVLDTKLHLFNYLEFVEAKDSEWLYIMLKNGAELIVIGERNEDTELVNNLMKKMSEMINNNKDIALSEEQKNDIISELKDSSLVRAVALIPKQPSNENRLVAKKNKKETSSISTEIYGLKPLPSCCSSSPASSRP